MPIGLYWYLRPFEMCYFCSNLSDSDHFEWKQNEPDVNLYVTSRSLHWFK